MISLLARSPRRMLSRVRNWRTRRIIAASGLLDQDFYLKTNPDVAKAQADPLRHYLDFGRHEGRSPSKEFSPQLYLAANPDVAKAHVDPVVHYIRHGRPEGRVASVRRIILESGLFDPDYYRAAHLDVALSGQTLVDHYIDHGEWEGRLPSLDFDPQFYLAANPDVKLAGLSPLVHYIVHGRAEGRCCKGPGLSSREVPGALSRLRAGGLFDDAFYLRRCPVVRKAGVDPLFHYLIAGYKCHLEPSPTLSMREYTLRHPEVWDSGLPALLHLMMSSDWECHDGANTLDVITRLVSTEAGGDSPDYGISLQRMAEVAYFSRFQFPFESVESPGNFAADAIAELVCRTTELKIERIEPDVSIVIPVYGQLHYLLGCLDSLALHRSRFSVEIIVVDDASPDATQTQKVAAIPWIRYRRRERNGGFIDACNDAAGVARGRFLVLLNSDTRVASGWLDELIESFEIFPKAGLIGSKLFNADGSLQEAGGIYWRDGSAWNYGHNEDANLPKYCFARQVDYVSAASIAIPSEIWRRLDGFDTAYRPAYCEDADLAFRLRELDYQVWLQPLSRVLHYEGKTHGRDLSTGVKAYQQVNIQRLAKRWKSRLASHRPNGHEPDREANRVAGDRILVLDAGTPKPDQDSGSFITFRMLQALQMLGYQITFVPQHNYCYEGAYTDALERMGVECLYEPYFCNITDALDYRDDFDIVLAYRFCVLDNIYSEIRKRLPRARMILHDVDLHFLREQREADLQGSRSKKITAAVTRSAELELMAKVDCTIVHTPVEREIIRQFLSIDNIVVFPYIAELHKTQVAFEERYDIMFLGGFAHPPNIDAVQHFASAVWPSLVRHLPDQARFIIVGAAPPREIQSLAGDRIVVTGFVKDLQPYFDTARVFVAPLRYGAGIKGKVIQSLCYGTPMVLTSIASEGTGLISGQQAIVADEDVEFASSVMRIYSDRSLWYLLQTLGYQFVEERYSWKRCLDLCRRVLDTADATWLARHERAMRHRLDDLIRESNGN